MLAIFMEIVRFIRMCSLRYIAGILHMIKIIIIIIKLKYHNTVSRVVKYL